ncbi:uncharacterized protein LOC143537304 [Bidens hawaiensis]|uniref:uncharacterized protein LOC143537304 n=1 Tax=Bidens hawaiensis TaxID=980011 RepID=UPI00404A4348
MDGQSKSQRVVLIHDASRDMRLNGVKWALDGFSLKDGDAFILLAVVSQVHHPMGYKIRVDSSMFGGANQRAIDDEIARKKKEFDDNLQLGETRKLYQLRKVDFKIELVAGPIPKNAAVDASKKCNATWVILDRKMKRDKKYFLEKLSCGISTMKDNDDIVDIRGLRRKQPPTSLSYGEMLPVHNKLSTREAPNDQEYFSIELDSSYTGSTSTRTSFSDGMLTTGNNQDDKINELSTLLETSAEEQENSPGNNNKVPISESEEKVIVDEKKCIDCDTTSKPIEEVNDNVESVGQSQPFENEVDYGFGGMSPVPKQAKHFYQGLQI